MKEYDKYIGVIDFSNEGYRFDGYDDVTSIKGDRYFCLTSLALCIDCPCCKKGE